MTTEIAIIGVGCNFPGSAGLAAFRQTVRAARVHTREVPAERWDHSAFVNANPRAIDKTYARKAAFLDDIKSFAPGFYGIAPKRARLMDPQQRLMLDVSRQAIEDAGYAGRRLPESTGVFVGASLSDHKDIVTSRVHVPLALAGRGGRAPVLTPEQRAALLEHTPPLQAYSMMGQQLNMIAANVSQAFDFKGPAFAVDTACSSSLVALHEAVLHLRAGRIAAAIVGGVYVILDPVLMICFSRIGALSRSDACRPFTAAADGFVLGEGAGAVVLKRLADAERDGDRVWAVIRGVAVNNDGRGDGPITPSAEGQAAVLRDAYRDAGVDPASVDLIEAHGTATAAGDRAESTALRQFFGTGCGHKTISSVKAIIGHGLASSGMASLIKAVLAVHEGFLPAQPAGDRPTDDLGLEFLTAPRPWERAEVGPRRAGVSSFGFGGTNAHVVIESPPDRPQRALTARPLPFVFSAPSAALLHQYLSTFSAPATPNVALADVAFTLGARRRFDATRVSFVAANAVDFSKQLALAQATVRGESNGDGQIWYESKAVLSLGNGVEENSVADVARAWAQGRPMDLESWFAGSGARLAALPSSLLATRPLWLIEDRRVALAAAVSLREVLFAAVATVTGQPVAGLRGTQRLRADLAFDSLMAEDLAAQLKGHLSAPLPLSAMRLGADQTLDELVQTVERSTVIAPKNGGEVRRLELSLESHPWLADHVIDGRPTLPLAAAVDLALQGARSQLGAGTLALLDFSVEAGVVLEGGTQRIEVRVTATGDDAVTVEISAVQAVGNRVGFRGRVEREEGELEELAKPGDGRPPRLTLDEFYAQHAFHGPRLRGVLSTPVVGDGHVAGAVRTATEIAAAETDILALDSVLQLALFWVRERHQCAAWPLGLAEYRHLNPRPVEGAIECLGVLRKLDGDHVVADFDLRDTAGRLVGQLRGLRARLSDHGGQRAAVDQRENGIADFPEVVALRERKAAILAAGLSLPYFVPHEGVTGATAKIGGRDYVNFSSYNYLGLSGDEAVTSAAIAATRRYGTSVSASRVASGERPLHRELEMALADFLGCEDAMLFVSGYATNVTVIGHLFGPEDVIVHDSLAHDSILAGSRLSGARRRPFPHGDMAALDTMLQQLRPTARRLLIVAEGVYSMDGDIAPLDRLIELKRRHGALLMIDEAHSLGVVGATGRGIGEHFKVNRADVDLWMGTLSKALSSCGGYIAGSAALIDYLKFTAPGFVYSVGLSPSDSAAAAAALGELRARPELVARLQANSSLFLALCREQGVNTGLSQGSAVVPCLVGASGPALLLAQRLFQRGINVQPILSPAVEERLARLRFFLSAQHTEVQLRTAVETLAEELQQLDR